MTLQIKCFVFIGHLILIFLNEWTYLFDFSMCLCLILDSGRMKVPRKFSKLLVCFILDDDIRCQLSYAEFSCDGPTIIVLVAIYIHKESVLLCYPQTSKFVKFWGNWGNYRTKIKLKLFKFFQIPQNLKIYSI